VSSTRMTGWARGGQEGHEVDRKGTGWTGRVRGGQEGYGVDGGDRRSSSHAQGADFWRVPCAPIISKRLTLRAL